MMFLQDAVDKLLEVHKDKVAASSRCRTKGMKIQGAVDPLGLLTVEVRKSKKSCFLNFFYRMFLGIAEEETRIFKDVFQSQALLQF